jgi:hypothetical protein
MALGVEVYPSSYSFVFNLSIPLHFVASSRGICYSFVTFLRRRRPLLS